MLRKIFLLASLSVAQLSIAQCDSIPVSGDLTVNSTTLMSGVYVVDGVFTIPSGVTVYVTPYSANGCGELKIYADEIYILGEIDGNYAGFVGGDGGERGNDVTSATGHASSLTSCNDSGSEGHIAVQGGLGGNDGTGPGKGIGGDNGQNGSGTKQYCGNFGDEAGMVGGAGGAGGGSGAAYGGAGSIGDQGGAGSNSYTASSLDVQLSYNVVAGNGGNGGGASSIYGTVNGMDIQKGSGGAGAGGGGRSHYLGTIGDKGGNGGGMVFLKAADHIEISGSISVDGEDGSYGGSGGSGDATADCCSDGCSGCDERTFSAGSGAGSGAGAGSGGGIYIETQGSLSFTGVLSANGGVGGSGGSKGVGATCDYGGSVFCSGNSMTTDDGSNGGAGGSGGGGRIKLFTPDCSQATISGSYSVSGGQGTNPATEGSYAEVCGYLSVAENEQQAFVVYPNPFTTQLTVELGFSDSYSVSLMDATGKTVYSNEDFGSEVQIATAEFPAGLYLLQIATSNGIQTHKLIKR